MKEELVKLITTRIYCRTTDAEKLSDEILNLFPVSDQMEDKSEHKHLIA